MSMQIVNLIQGTPEWHAHRAKHFNASDAPAMMGCSSYKSRSDLIKELATGITKEVDLATQRRFDDGHRFEALARPLAEEIIGEDLSPCVGVKGKYSASFDGLTFMHDQAFEHKSLNNALREAMFDGCTGADLPMEYRVQMEQQAMVSGCERILFMASKWEGEEAEELAEERHCWYEPDAELRAQIIAGWEQLEQEVAAYAPEEAKPEVIGQAPDALPALRIEIQGGVTASNLDAFKIKAVSVIRSIKTELQTDADFADAEKTVKWCEEVETRLSAAKEHALSQTESIDLLFRTIDEISEESRQVRLKLSKLVKSEKEARKTQIVMDAKQDLDAHIGRLERRLEALDDHKKPCHFPNLSADFAGAIKGLKSLDSMRDKVAVTLTNAKLEASQVADKLEANRKHLVQADGDWISLFADFWTVGTKEAEDFQILAAHRIGQHKQAEAARLEAQREQIRKEEAERLERETAKKERQRIQEQLKAEQADINKAQQDGELPAPLAQDLTVLVEDKAAEQVAGIDARQVIAAAKTGVTSSSEGETLKLGQVNTMLKDAGLGQISAETLETNGITFTKERGAVLIQTSDVHRLLIKMAMGMRKLADEFTAHA